MAVLIQEQVNAEKSGVVFTKNPFNPNDNTLIIEVVKGLGDKLVSGEINPHRYDVNKKNLASFYKNGEVFERNMLTTDEIALISRCAMQIEDFFNYPQDIEWSIEKGELYIHQSRDLKIS